MTVGELQHKYIYCHHTECHTHSQMQNIMGRPCSQARISWFAKFLSFFAKCSNVFTQNYSICINCCRIEIASRHLHQTWATQAQLDDSGGMIHNDLYCFCRFNLYPSHLCFHRNILSHFNKTFTDWCSNIGATFTQYFRKPLRRYGICCFSLQTPTVLLKIYYVSCYLSIICKISHIFKCPFTLFCPKSFFRSSDCFFMQEKMPKQHLAAGKF